MCDAVLPVRSKPIYALLYLLAVFAAGPLLVYSLGTDRPPSAATPTETGVPIASSSADSPGSPQIETESAAQYLALDERLSNAQIEIQRLKQRLAALSEQHMRLASAFAEHSDTAPLILADVQASAESVMEPQTKGPIRLEDDLARLAARPTERGHLVTLAETELSFPVGRSELSPERAEGLRAIADVLARREGLIVRIEGHTDSSGSASRNLALSQARAESVKDALVALGIERDRIQTEGLGETRPLTDNQTAEARLSDRRVEVYLIEASPEVP